MADELMISTNNRLDVDYVHAYLSDESYWAKGRSRAVTEKAIANSLCFGVYAQDRQVGFARVVTDCATFGWPMCLSTKPITRAWPRQALDRGCGADHREYA